MQRLDFTLSKALSMGVELELQILNTRDYNLARAADDLLKLAAKTDHPGDIKPEMTESMIEVSTGVHDSYATLRQELLDIRDAMVPMARKLNIALAGGGSHPFQKWTERRIYPKERFQYLSALYGYLAKQFTIFGQHIHIGCDSGDAAVYLAHAFTRYVPHFIALSASSPFLQGVDSAFDSSRLNAVSAFPLSGTMPRVSDWEDFNRYFNEMIDLGIVKSMKDFYWDIRPKPEFGTIEIRVPDTPLDVERAAQLAAYAQTLARYLLAERPDNQSRAVSQVYTYNRFLACRFGFEGNIIDPYARQPISLKEDILATLAMLKPHAVALGTEEPLKQLQNAAASGRNDSTWLREQYEITGSLSDVARLQSEVWTGEVAIA
ncbi:MAG: glutamate--cysteine ligase [Burkholderiales bacterium]|nr:glutamate--cysteine ligase [Burkholderiales bacterium]